MKTEILKILAKHLTADVAEVELASWLEMPPDEKMGDYALPCFGLAKKLRRSPVQIAENLAQSLAGEALFTKVQAVSGYLNLFLDRRWLSGHILPRALEPNFGTGNSGQTTVVEYCSPNTNKPLHLGHLRNMAIGESVARLLAFQGNKLVKTCVYNDRGVHICKSMLAYQDFGAGATPERQQIKSDHFVGDYYVRFAQQAKTDSNYEPRAQAMLENWEAGDAETLALWRRMNDWAFAGFRETFRLFGTAFDREYYESALYKHGKEIVQDGVDKGLFAKRDDGAVVADLTAAGLDEKVLLRSNGTAVYIVQDLYLAHLKAEEFGYDQSIYVVGNEQEYHFKVLKEILGRLGNEKVAGIHHLSYGMVELPEGKMKSREGTVVDADDLILDTQELAAQEIRKRYQLNEEEVKERALKIALAALKFQLLKTETGKNMVFNPKEAIRFEGDTGPYLLYSYARASSILRKAELESKVAAWEADDVEARLLKKLAQFTDTAALASERLMPSLLANYAFELAQNFNEFYHECPVLRSEVPGERLSLVSAFRKVCGQCLELLGIDKIEAM